MQLGLPNMVFEEESFIDDSQWRISSFSADNVNPQKARLDLEKKYWPLTEISDRFNRRNVSCQKNKNKNLHRWLKYKEGFSAELFRVCKSGAYVAFVNDNVRYAGEVIPVDFLTTDIARQLGFTPVKIYTTRQMKGNSSQQMKKYGRVALRKSVTVWKK